MRESDPVLQEDAPGHTNVVVTRLEPISQQALLVRREYLLDALDVARSGRLVLLTAPAGYGKSTLLTQWRERLIARNIKTAWLSLDDEDGGAGGLVTYLLYSLSRAGIPFGQDLMRSTIPNEATAKQRLRQILNGIATAAEDTVLILDEIDNLSEKTVELILSPLIRWAPNNLVVVIACRTAPPLPLSTLRVQGLLTEFKASDLRFTPSEINALFAQDLSRQEIATIDRQTEGWPVALQLLRGCWSRDRDRSQVLEAYTGLTEEIAQYLSEQVFARLPVNIYNFLVEASIIDRLSMGSVERVLGDTHNWKAVLQSDLLRPFLMLVDKDVGAYRLHPVLRDGLSVPFSQLPAERRRALHASAAQWYAQSQHLVRAVRHALLAEDLEMAASLILEAGGTQIWIRQGFSRLKAIDALLLPELLERFPRLTLLRAFVLAKDGSISPARRLIESVREQTNDFNVDPSGGDVAGLRLDGMVVRATLLFNECRAASDEYLDAYEATLRRISGDDHIFLAHAKTVLCLSCHQRGLFDRAMVAGHEAIDYNRQANLPHGEFFDLLHLGAINVAQGMREAAEQSFSRAQHLARKHFPDDWTKCTLLAIATADLAYECNQIAVAERKLRSIDDQLARTEGWFEVYAAAYGAMAIIALTTQGIDAALARLDNAWQTANERQLIGLKPFLAATRVSCLTLAGLTDEAGAVVEQSGFDLEHFVGPTNGLWREDEGIIIALARLAVERRDTERLREVLPGILQRLKVMRHVRSYIRLAVIAAIASDQAGEQDIAHSYLQAALSQSARTGYQRVFHEEGSQFVSLLRRYVRNMPDDLDSLVRNHAQDLLSMLDVGPKAKKTYVTLSPREIQVLRELSGGHPDKVIARALDLTENTVKYHLKNIYAKLRVGTRTEAVLSARKRGLI